MRYRKYDRKARKGRGEERRDSEEAETGNMTEKKGRGGERKEETEKSEVRRKRKEEKRRTPTIE